MRIEFMDREARNELNELLQVIKNSVGIVEYCLIDPKRKGIRELPEPAIYNKYAIVTDTPRLIMAAEKASSNANKLLTTAVLAYMADEQNVETFQLIKELNVLKDALRNISHLERMIGKLKDDPLYDELKEAISEVNRIIETMYRTTQFSNFKWGYKEGED